MAIRDIIGSGGGKLGSAGVMFMKFIAWTGVLLILGTIITLIVLWVRDRKLYNMPVRLIRILENGTKKELNGLRGGKVRVKGVFTFKVKMPGKWKKHDVGYIPDFSKTDGDNRLVFISVGDGTLWQQCSERIETKEKVVIKLSPEDIQRARKNIEEHINSNESLQKLKEEEKKEIIENYLKKFVDENKEKIYENDLIMTPIKTEVKTATVNSLKSWKEIFERNKMKAFTIAIGAFLLMVVAHLVSLFIQTKIKCGVPAG